MTTPRIGDKVIVPWRLHRNGTDAIAGWHGASVVARRGAGHLVVLCFGYEQVHPCYEVKPYPRRRGDWPKVA